jgi:hypothetical protein
MAWRTSQALARMPLVVRLTTAPCLLAAQLVMAGEAV